MPASDARRAMLDNLIDHAGLFPPARLAMAEAVADYQQSEQGQFGWILGRFICPASRLQELLTLPTVPGRLSILVDDAGGEAARWPEQVDATLARAVDLVAERSEVEAVEVRAPVEDPDRRSAIAAVGRLQPAMVAVYIEVPIDDDLPHWLEAIEQVPLAGAKVRTGGLAAEAFPSVEQLGRFIDACRRRSVPFKATAGLHHPFRHRDPATGFVHHGFVNLFLAALLAARHDLDQAVITEILADEDARHFTLGRDELRWRELAVEAGPALTARHFLARSYGSCSFAEPTEDLARMGVLPVGEPA